MPGNLIGDKQIKFFSLRSSYCIIHPILTFLSCPDVDRSLIMQVCGLFLNFQHIFYYKLTCFSLTLSVIYYLAPQVFISSPMHSVPKIKQQLHMPMFSLKCLQSLISVEIFPRFQSTFIQTAIQCEGENSNDYSVPKVLQKL